MSAPADPHQTRGPSPVELLAALPLACIVFDANGIITRATPRLVRLFDPDGTLPGGLSPADFVGRNILEFIHPDDQGFAGELLAFGTGVPNEIMGPMRLRYLTVGGEERYAEAWGENRLDTPGVEGHVVVVAEEATHHRFTDAVTLVAQGEPLGRVADTLVAAMRGHPVKGLAVIVERTSGGELVSLSRSELPGELLDGSGEWWAALLASGPGTTSFNPAEFGPRVSRVAGSDPRLGSVWITPVDFPGRDISMVCWHRSGRGPSPNQALHLEQARGILGLALAQESQRRELRRMAYHDALTGLYNRAHLYEHVGAGDMEGSSLLFLDLDGFKAVNDLHGHAIGDALLNRVAEVLTRNVRDIDAVARIGGDEFVIVVGSATDRQSIRALADRLVAQVAGITSVQGRPVTIGASIGVVHHSGDLGLEEMMRAADRALYEVKAGGRGSWKVHVSV